MEYLTSLDKYSALKELTAAEVIKAGLDIASALSVCHAENIMHRDIKTANIFVNEKDIFKLGDFGLAKKLTDSARAKSKVGTDAYKAPEVFNPYGKYDKTADIYSLGLVLYELFNHGRLPFMPEYPQTYGPHEVEEAISRRVQGEIPPHPMVASKTIAEVIVKACSPNPKDRYQTADELRLALQIVLTGLGEKSKPELCPSRVIKRVIRLIMIH
jgi:serine/threonine protein kinase